MDSFNSNIILRNNTGNKPKASLINGFVVRTNTFRTIFSEIKSAKSKHDNYVIIGQRGAGKTTLLYRLKYAIEDDEKLNKVIIPIMFSEEQYNLIDLYSLWENIADYLENVIGFELLASEISSLKGSYTIKESQAYDLLKSQLALNKKTITLFIENIDAFFKKIGKDGQARLHSVLSEGNLIRLICSSTFYFDSINSEKEVFHDFFTVVQLNGLSKSESIILLNKLAEQYNSSEHIKNVIEKYPKRLESLRRLTGGNPRIISYLFQIFLDNEDGKAIVDLYKLLDNITFLYKSELDQLSPQQQRIIDSIARSWDAVSTKEISANTGIDGKTVSSVLNALEKNQVVEIVATKTKNKLYRLKDRFLNIWYLMRFGKNKERADVVWLVRFYDAWCDKTELSNHIDQYINNLREGTYDIAAALDMGNVFLSCANVPQDVKYDIYRTTKAILPLDKVKDLKMSRTLLYKSVTKLFEHKKYDEAIEVLSELGDDEKYYDIASFLYYKKGDVVKSIEYAIKLYDITPSSERAMQIASMYEEIDNFNRAIQYYKLAVSHDCYDAYLNLGLLYSNMGNDTEAEKNFKLGIKHDVEKSYNALATLYYKADRLEEGAKILENAIERGVVFKGLKNNLALIYHKQNRMSKAATILNDAVQEGNTDAYISLGIMELIKEEPDFDAAKELFLKAIHGGNVNGYHHLGQLYLEYDMIEESEKCLLEGYAKEDPDSAHLLGHIYSQRDEWDKGKIHFLKSIEWGRISTLRCLSRGAIFRKKSREKDSLIQLFEKHIEEIRGKLAMEMMYAIVLLWNKEVDKALGVFQAQRTKILLALEGNKDENLRNRVIDDVTQFFIMLMSIKEFNIAFDLFKTDDFKYKQILKPVYYSLMNFMKNEHPNEYLKAGDELKEAIEEIIETVDDYKALLN
jgi:tetratricopeptide (TPR) repeat protein